MHEVERRNRKKIYHNHEVNTRAKIASLQLLLLGSIGGCFYNMQLLLKTWIDAKIELFPLIKPNFCQPGIIMVDYFGGTPRKGIRGRFSENMPNMRAGGNHQFTPAHPNL